MKTSLIVTTYNRPDALELVLLSILNQYIQPDEVVIADDGSTGETQELIKQYQSLFSIPLIHVWQEDNGFRVAMARNKAIAKAKGDYIITIDGDILLHKFFIYDHINHAQKKQFIQGSRVLLSKKTTNELIDYKRIKISLWKDEIKNHFNAIYLPGLSLLAGKISSKQNIAGVRSCNFSLWKDDIIKINGFNEDFVGWGREDSELVLRLINSGVRRLNLKFAGIGYHLWHQSNQNIKLLKQNDETLQLAMKENRKFCEKGINQYL